MSAPLMIFLIVCWSVTIVGFSLAAYWMRGATLYNRSTAAYRRGDIAEGDRLKKRAERWTIGAKA